MSQLSEEERLKGVVTRSSGNFAQAVAYAAQKINVKATVVMPQNTPQIKVKGTEKYGAKIQFSENSHEIGDAIAQSLAIKEGYACLHPYNHYQTMAGQGTAALEILQQCPDVHHFFCPIGGGGLLSGCATALKESNAAIFVYGIEPQGAGDYAASRKTGKHESWQKIDTIADGLRAAAVGKLNYPILNRYVDEAHVVADVEIKKAMRWIYDHSQMVIEPSGAVSLAGFMAQYKQLKGNVVILISGQNVDQENFKTWIKEASND